MMRIDACRWVRSRLALLAGGDLVGPDRRRTERHLVGCPDCRRHQAALREAVAALRAAGEVPALSPAAQGPLWPALSRQIRESRRGAPLPWLGVLARPSLGLAATLLLTVGVVALWPGFGPDPAAPASSGPRVAERPRIPPERAADDVPEHALAERPALPREVDPFSGEHARLGDPSPVEDTR